MILAQQNPALISRTNCESTTVCTTYISKSVLACEHTAVMWQMLVASFVWGILVCAAKECEEAWMLQTSERPRLDRRFPWDKNTSRHLRGVENLNDTLSTFRNKADRSLTYINIKVQNRAPPNWMRLDDS
jgi:hypothetical protein